MPAIDNVAGGASGLRLTKEALAMLGIESGLAPGEYGVSDQKLALNPPTTWSVPTGLVATQTGTRLNPTGTTIWRLNATTDDTLHGPHQVFTLGALFQNTWVRSLYIGYNPGAGGGAQVGTDNTFYMAFEPDYDDSTKRTDEWHLDWAGNAAEIRADGVTTQNQPTVTSASGGFLSKGGGPDAGRWYVGRSIVGAGIPANTYIGVVNSDTSIGLSSSRNSNVPVNATASASGVSLTIKGLSVLVANSAVSFRPIFIQVNKATGDVTDFELNSTNGFNFNSSDGLQTQWGTLTDSGLTITPRTGHTAALVLNGIAGSSNNIQIGNGSNQLLIQPAAAGAAPWTFTVGSKIALSLGSTANALFGDSAQSFNGVIAAASGGNAGDVSCFFAGVRTGQTTSALIVRNVDTSTYLTSIEANGLFRWIDATTKQTTVGAAGGASALPATPTKYLKVQDGSTVLVVPAYAPS